MRIKVGNDRIVLLLPLLGVAIKFARIRLVKAFASLAWQVTDGSFEWIYLTHPPINGVHTFKGFLFGGVITNVREYRLYQRTKSPFLQPTHFSFFGLLNVQELGNPCMIEEDDLFRRLCGITENAVFRDTHHFCNPKNFCISESRLRMIDYGGKRMRKVILKYGEKIWREFTFRESDTIALRP